MLVSEIRDRTLLETGNLYFQDLSELDVSPSMFLTMIRNVLDYWKGYTSWTKIVEIEPAAVASYNMMDLVESGVLPHPPRSVRNLTTVRSARYLDPTTLLFQYDEPYLKLLSSYGNTRIKAELEMDWHLRQVTETDKQISQQVASGGSSSVPRLGGWNPREIYLSGPDVPRAEVPSAPEDELTKWEIVGLESEPKLIDFLNLVIGKFMITLGRARRGFILNESPVQLDGDSLIQEGQQLWDITVETVEETSDVFSELLNTPVSGGLL